MGARSTCAENHAPAKPSGSLLLQAPRGAQASAHTCCLHSVLAAGVGGSQRSGHERCARLGRETGTHRPSTSQNEPTVHACGACMTRGRVSRSEQSRGSGPDAVLGICIHFSFFRSMFVRSLSAHLCLRQLSGAAPGEAQTHRKSGCRHSAGASTGPLLSPAAGLLGSSSATVSTISAPSSPSLQRAAAPRAPISTG